MQGCSFCRAKYLLHLSINYHRFHLLPDDSTTREYTHGEKNTIMCMMTCKFTVGKKDTVLKEMSLCDAKEVN